MSILTNMDYKLKDREAITTNNDLERKEKIKKYQKQLKKLKKIPLLIQKSEEWYNARQTLITASDFGQCLGVGKFGTVKDIYRKKCGYEEDTISFKAPMEWGNKYEEVACKIYQHLMNVKVDEFGLIRHPKISHIGASPDGISEYGIMLEIKCPWKRKNKNEIPEQYYYQIQGQLEVCDLEECDYIECYIKQYDKEDYIDDDEHEFKGMIKMNDGEYVYSELNSKDMMDGEEVTYWYLEEYFLKRVFRDKELFKKMSKELKIIWNNIEKYKNNKELYNSEIKIVEKPPKFLFRKDID